MNKRKIKLISLLSIATVGIGLAVWLSSNSKRHGSEVFEPSATVSPLEREETVHKSGIMQPKRLPAVKEETVVKREASPESKIILSKEDAETIATLVSEKPMPANIEPLTKDDISFLFESDVVGEEESKTLLELEDLLKRGK